MGVLQACLAPTELREHLTLQRDRQQTKGKEKERGDASTANWFETTCRWCGRKGHKESQWEAYTAQQKPAGQMAALSGSSTIPASHGTDHVLGLEQELSSMGAVSSKRPLMDSGAAAHDKEEVTYKNSGGKVQTVQRSDGTDGAVTITCETLDVARPTCFVGKCVTAGYAVWFTPNGSGMCEASMFEHSIHGPYIPLSMVLGVYEVPVHALRAGQSKKRTAL
eukprot:6490591-Amphidinium_carterae.1